MLVLALTLAALVVPPFFAEGFRQRPGVASFLDGFVLVAIGALVLGDVLPAAFASAGWAALLAALVGLAVPSFAERMGFQGRVVHGAGVVVGQFALLAHAGFDGVALGTAEAAGPAIAAAVVLHQVPVGVSAWLSMRARLGVRAAAVALAMMSLATVAGYFLGGAALASSPRALVGVLAGLSAGTLFHVVGHARLPGAEIDAPQRPWRWSGVGGGFALAGLAASHAVPWLLGAEESHGHDTEGVLVGVLGDLAGPYLFGVVLQAGLRRWRTAPAWLLPLPVVPLALVGGAVGPVGALALALGVLAGGVAGGIRHRPDRSDPDATAEAALVVGWALSTAVSASGLRLGALPLTIQAALALALVQVPLPLTTHAVLAGALVGSGWAPGLALASLLGGHAWPGGLRRHLRGTPREVRAALVGGGAAIVVGAGVAAAAGARASGGAYLDARSALVAGVLLGAWLVGRLVARGPRGWISDVLGPSLHEDAADHPASAHHHHLHEHDHAPANVAGAHGVHPRPPIVEE